MTDDNFSNALKRATEMVRGDLLRHSVPLDDSIEFIRHVYTIVRMVVDEASAPELWLKLSCAVIDELHKGADGVSGTDDDLLSAETASLLKTLLGSGVVAGIVGLFNHIHDIQTERVINSLGCCVSSCLGGK